MGLGNHGSVKKFKEGFLKDRDLRERVERVKGRINIKGVFYYQQKEMSPFYTEGDN